MTPRITLRIDRNKVAKEHCYQGKNGLYLDVALFDNKDGQKSQYGDDGFVVQKVSKEARQRGEKGPIVGNWRFVEEKQASTPAPAPKAAPKPADDDEDGVPF